MARYECASAYPTLLSYINHPMIGRSAWPHCNLRSPQSFRPRMRGDFLSMCQAFAGLLSGGQASETTGQMIRGSGLTSRQACHPDREVAAGQGGDPAKGFAAGQKRAKRKTVAKRHPAHSPPLPGVSTGFRGCTASPLSPLPHSPVMSAARTIPFIGPCTGPCIGPNFDKLWASEGTLEDAGIRWPFAIRTLSGNLLYPARRLCTPQKNRQLIAVPVKDSIR